MRILVGTPHGGRIEPLTALRVAEFLCDRVRKGDDAVWAQYEHPYVHVGRMALAEEALRREVDGILYWDADTTIEDASLADYLFGQDVATAAVRSRHKPEQYALYRERVDGTLVAMEHSSISVLGDLPRLPFNVAASGAALLWVAARVLRDLKRRGGVFWPPFRVIQDGNGGVSSSEDICFSRAVREAGYSIVCDPRIPTGHIGSRVIVHAPKTEE